MAVETVTIAGTRFAVPLRFTRKERQEICRLAGRSHVEVLAGINERDPEAVLPALSVLLSRRYGVALSPAELGQLDRIEFTRIEEP